MITQAAKDAMGGGHGGLRREHLCMVRIESNFRDMVVRRRRWRKPITRRVCEVSIFLRFDHAPDIDYVRVDGSPFTLVESGDDVQLSLPPTLVTIS